MVSKSWPSIQVALILVAVIAIASPVVGGDFWEKFKDKEDGALDVSDWLMEDHGFLPVPIVITEPALGGFGLGLAAAFFHDFNTPKEVRGTDAAAEYRHHPPSVTAPFLAYTANDSKIAGAAHSGSYKKDTIRYVGALAITSLNLSIYADDQPLEFNIEGGFLFQELLFRISDSPWFVGGEYTLMDSEAKFDLGIDDPEISPLALDSSNAGLGFQALYDTRDNFFTATEGQKIKTQVIRFDQAVGGDFDYWKVNLEVLSYHHLHPKWILALKLKAEFTDGEVPFYGLPFVQLRGIPAMRYQGKSAVAFEAEGRWKMKPRWTLIGFAGKGWTDGDEKITKTEENIVAFGTGFRYKIARKMGLDVGIDIARGPEDTAFYLQMGSAW